MPHGCAKYMRYSHYDVVAAGKGWNSDPWTMRAEDGYFYGRGVSDNKGSCASLCKRRVVERLRPVRQARCWRKYLRFGDFCNRMTRQIFVWLDLTWTLRRTKLHSGRLTLSRTTSFPCVAGVDMGTMLKLYRGPARALFRHLTSVEKELKEASYHFMFPPI